MGTSLPLVLLAPRVTDDSVRIWKAAIDEGWSVQRLPGWRVTEDLRHEKHDLSPKDDRE
ncbi:hypothetical protein [Chthoniobacter flavus]|uniref:hypothetical protein n=1 Tax=Chthoniobacter flavus TaxID=191863 RepID=UPI0012F814F0|nr:hypothetical protein [Chthoniobacter flavus]